MMRFKSIQGIVACGFALFAAVACSAQPVAERTQEAEPACGALSRGSSDISGWGYIFDFSGCVTGGESGFRFGEESPVQSSMASFDRQSNVRVFGDTARTAISPMGLRVERRSRNYLYDGGNLLAQNSVSAFGTVSLETTGVRLTSERAESTVTRIQPMDHLAKFQLSYRLAERRPGSAFAWSFRLRATSGATQVSVRTDDGQWRRVDLSVTEWTPIAISPRHNGDRQTSLEIWLNDVDQDILWDRGQLEQANISGARCTSDRGRSYRRLGTFVERVHNNNCSYLAATSWMESPVTAHCDAARMLPGACFASRGVRPLAIDLRQRSRMNGAAVSDVAALADRGTIVAIWRPHAAYLNAGTVYDWRDCVDADAEQCASNGAREQDYRNLNWRVAGSPYQFQVGTHSSSASRGSDGLNVHRVPFHRDPGPTATPGDLYRIGDAAYDLPWQLMGRALPANIIRDNRVNIAAHSWDYPAISRAGREPRATRIMALNGTSRVHRPRVSNSSVQLEMDRLTFGARADGGLPINGEILAILIMDRVCSAAALEAFSRGDLTLPPTGTIIDPMEERWCTH